MREKRAVQHESYYPMLLPEFELYGIKPSGGALDAASTCVCAKKPSSKVRKSLDMYVSWNDSLKDTRSRKSPRSESASICCPNILGQRLSVRSFSSRNL